ncbi:MAG: tetratricopeptide repeat protein [Acidobacteria bacterium]|nr:tetratricopeptide repeat protein [Acidobacteriota bacterium]
MKRKAREGARGYDAAPILKTGGLALALGLAAWLAGPLLFPVKLPADFPKLPNLEKANPGLRALLQRADEEARRKPGSAELVGKLALGYHSNLFVEQADRAYRIAARLAPGDHQWVYALSVLLEENGNEQEQVALLQRTVRLKPDHVPALIKTADWLFKQDRLDEAARYYEQAANVPAGGAALQATFALGRVAARRREWDRAIGRLVPLVRSYPHVAPPYEVLQEAYDALGQADKATEARRSGALAQWKIVPPPEDPLIEQLIGVCYSSTRMLKQAGLLSRVGQPGRAIQIARRAAQTNPAEADVRNYLARTLLTFFGDKPEGLDEALAQLAECLRLKPDELSPLWSFTNEFFNTPKPAAATERLAGLLRPHAELPESHFYQGLIADARGDSAEAVSQYRAALKHNPKDSAAYNKLGLILDRAGKFDEAIAHLQKAVQLNPVNTGARFNLGVALMQRGSYGQAVKELAELLRVNPHDAAAHFCMGFALLYSKRSEESILKFREGLRYKPDDAEAHSRGERRKQ